MISLDESGVYGAGRSGSNVYREKRKGVDGCGCGQGEGEPHGAWCAACPLSPHLSTNQPPGPVISQAGGGERQTGHRVRRRM